MRVLNLSLHRKARVWLGELPDLPHVDVDVLEYALPAGEPVVTEQRRAAIEVMIPTGARIIYGLLGVEFSAEDTSQLLVQVAVSPNDGEVVPWSIADRSDEVRAGLPHEYVDGVVAGVNAAESPRLLGSGVLRFNCAAHGAVGSSQDVFRRAAMIVVRLLCLDPRSVSEQRLVELLEEQLSLSRR